MPYLSQLGYKTIGQIVEFCQKYYPFIANRYKGLGELTKYEMHKLVMNPNYRKLAQYTVSDMERMNETMDYLFLKTPKTRKIRKQLVQTANITIDDIDN